MWRMWMEMFLITLTFELLHGWSTRILFPTHCLVDLRTHDVRWSRWIPWFNFLLWQQSVASVVSCLKIKSKGNRHQLRCSKVRLCPWDRYRWSEPFVNQGIDCKSNIKGSKNRWRTLSSSVSYTQQSCRQCNKCSTRVESAEGVIRTRPIWTSTPERNMK